MSTIVVSVLLMGAIIGGGLTLGANFLEMGSYIYSTIANGVTDSNQLVAAPVASTVGAQLIAQSPKLNLSADAKGCDLQSGGWKLWFGKLNSDVVDKTYFSLPTNSAQGLYKYQGEVPDVAVCEFVFVPRGDKAINYVVSYDGVYQIVIGDNDYWTISLRASDRVDGPLYPVEETITGKTRPRLMSAAKQGASMRARLERSLTQDGKYDVKLTITYQPEIQGDVDTPSESFDWRFTPSPVAALRQAELSIGLIRAGGDKSEVGVSFISPNPNEQPVIEDSVKKK